MLSSCSLPKPLEEKKYPQPHENSAEHADHTAKQVQVPAKAKWIDVLLELLRLSVRCILIRCQHQQKGLCPAGNRKSPSLLANDDATCFLAFAHA